MCDFVAVTAGETFFFFFFTGLFGDITELPHWFSPQGEAVSVWLVVRVCWRLMLFHGFCCHTLPWLREPDWAMSQRQTVALVACVIQPAHTENCNCWSEFFFRCRYFAVSVAICGHRVWASSWPQQHPYGFQGGRWREVRDKVIAGM